MDSSEHKFELNGHAFVVTIKHLSMDVFAYLLTVDGTPYNTKQVDYKGQVGKSETDLAEQAAAAAAAAAKEASEQAGRAYRSASKSVSEVFSWMTGAEAGEGGKGEGEGVGEGEGAGTLGAEVRLCCLMRGAIKTHTLLPFFPSRPKTSDANRSRPESQQPPPRQLQPPQPQSPQQAPGLFSISARWGETEAPKKSLLALHFSNGSP